MSNYSVNKMFKRIRYFKRNFPTYIPIHISAPIPTQNETIYYKGKEIN